MKTCDSCPKPYYAKGKCKTHYKSMWTHANPEAYRRKKEWISEYSKRPEVRAKRYKDAAAKRESRRRFLHAVKLTAGCIDCGFAENSAALHFDHIGEKKYTARELASRSWQTLQEEIGVCEVRCANCHAIKHQGKVRRGRLPID